MQDSRFDDESAPSLFSPLARRAFEELAQHLAAAGRGRPAMLPVFAMADRRRAVHLAALAEHPDWPVIPMASIVEQVATRHPEFGFLGQLGAAVHVLARR